MHRTPTADIWRCSKLVQAIIQTIESAERESEHILAQGRQQARAIATQAANDATAQSAAVLDAARTQVQRLLSQEEGYAHKRAQAVLQAHTQTLQTQKEQAAAKVEQAVALILSRIESSWQ